MGFGSIPDRQPVHENVTLLDWLEPVHTLDESALSRARWPAHNHDLSTSDRKRTVFQDLEIAVPFADFPDLYHRWNPQLHPPTSREAVKQITKYAAPANA